MRVFNERAMISMVLLLGVLRTGWAQPVIPAAVPEDGLAYPVSVFRIEYVRDNHEHPPLEPMHTLSIELARTLDGWVAPRDDLQSESITLAGVASGDGQDEIFRASGLQRILEALRDHLLDQGLMAVFVGPDPAHIDPEGVDHRDGRTELRLLITTGVVTELRTLASGSRLDPKVRINHPFHERIRARSPLQPYFGRSDQHDLLLRGRLDDYLFQLSRHPSRQVDAAVAAADDPLGIALDYHVTENRPLSLFAEVSNTGTRSTDRTRTRFGLLHTQLTNRDDILEVSYLTAGFEDTNQFVGSYEAPLFDHDRIRWRVQGLWNEYLASDVGFADDEFSGESWWVGAEVAATIHQHRETFVDVFGGVRYLDSEVSGPGGDGQERFILPIAGVRLERVTEWASTRGLISVDWQIAGLSGLEPDELDLLGRTEPDSDWAVLRWGLWHSTYLEPIFDRARWEDPSTPETSTLAHELAIAFRGQYAFDRRLIPELEQPVGGLFTVRGYPESETAGDGAILGTIEYRYHVPRAFSLEPEPRTLFGEPFRFAPQHAYGTTDWDLVLKGFVDVGRTLISDARPGETEETLVGAGIGLEFQYRRNLSIRLDWGFVLHELDDRNVNSGSNRLHVITSFLW